jgi:tetratricopeptide (TPR) repeat protein
LDFHKSDGGLQCNQVARCCKLKAIVLRKSGEYEESLGYATRAVEYYTKNLGARDERMTMDAVRTLAHTFYAMGNRDESLNTLEQVWYFFDDI